MTAAEPAPPSVLRSVAAVLLGVVVWTATALAADNLMMRLVPYSYGPDGAVQSGPVLTLTLGYSLLLGVLAGYVTAAVARRAELRHALALAVVVLLLSAWATVQFFATAPFWYHAAALTLLAPAVVAGGWARRRHRRDAATLKAASAPSADPAAEP